MWKFAYFIIAALLFLILLSRCNRFEKKFYSSIHQAQIADIGSDTSVQFDLSSITNFEWDSVLYVQGNESVPIHSLEIENILRRKTTDLRIFRDRFYFLQSDNNIIMKEIKSGMFSNRLAFHIDLCLADSIQQRFWLSKDESIFTVKSNTSKIGEGTVFLFPKCKTRLNPTKIKK